MISAINQSKVDNKLNQDFLTCALIEVIITDLTYVRVGEKGHYICLILDLFNCEIIGYFCEVRKDTSLVRQVFALISYPLISVKYFYTDRRKEFSN